MASKKNRTAAPSAGTSSATDIPVVGGREPCPCGSGRRYKACHGRAAAEASTTLVRRPFAGLPGECDWVALREIVPSATAPLVLAPEYAEKLGGRQHRRVVHNDADLFNRSDQKIPLALAPEDAREQLDQPRSPDRRAFVKPRPVPRDADVDLAAIGRVPQMHRRQTALGCGTRSGSQPFG